MLLLESIATWEVATILSLHVDKFISVRYIGLKNPDMQLSKN